MARPTKHTILSEIAPDLETATITLSNGKEIEVEAVPNRVLAKLFFRFPRLSNFKKPANGQAPNVQAEDAAELLEAMPAIIAAGLGYPGDTEIEVAMDRLPLADKDLVVAKVMELSMPPGVDGQRPLGSAKPSNSNGEIQDQTSP